MVLLSSFDFFMFRTRAWVPGGLSRGAWAPSLGSLGRLPGGGSRPNVLGPELGEPSGFRIVFFYVDFDIDF